MGQLLPVIKNYAWFQDEALILKEPLLDFDQSPVMGIGEDLDDKIQYSEASSPEAYAEELSARKKEALENLKNLEIAYEVQDVNGAKVVVASGQEFAAEKILDPTFLQKMHQELDSEQVAVGIPFQGLLIAISGKDSELLSKFPLVIKKHYDNPQADKISDKMFLSVNAKIIAHAGVDTESQHAAKPEPCFVQTMTLTGATEKDFEFVTFIGHKDLSELRAGFEKTYYELLAKCNTEQANTCIMKFLIIPDIIQKSDALVTLCNTLADAFTQDAQVKADAPGLRSLQAIFTYDQEDVMADRSYANA